MKIGRKIKAAREAAGLTQEQLADRCDYKNQSRISGYERDDREPSLDDLAKIAKATNLTSIAELLSFGEKEERTSSRKLKGALPVISYVQAGLWCEAIDLYEPGQTDRLITSAAPHSEYAFALRVEGHSMTAPVGTDGPSFPPGYFIHVDPYKESTFGDFVVARHDGNKVTFKKLSREEGRPVLVPLNPDYPIIREEFEVIGKVFDASFGGL